jgi:hypothetical protein
MSASNPLDTEGISEYEKEMLRKHRARVAAAMPSAVSTFAVPTTALLKAGQFQKQAILRRKKMPLPMFQVPASILANVGYAPLQEVRTTGYAGQYARVIQDHVQGQAAERAGAAAAPSQYSAADQALIALAAKGQITRLASTPAAQREQNAAMATAATKYATTTTPKEPTGYERYPGQLTPPTPKPGPYAAPAPSAGAPIRGPGKLVPM